MRLADGARVVGRKIGLTSAAVQQQLGVNQPDFGVLFGDMQCLPAEVVPSSRLLQPKIEAEIAFVLSADLDSEDLDARRFRGSVAYAVAALEIVDSRIADWNITIADTVADNASSGMFVLSEHCVDVESFEPAAVTMTMTKGGQVVSTGTGSACMGDPITACMWLARTTARFGTPLRAGDIVLSGALGPMVAVASGDLITAEISSLGTVSAQFD